MASVSTVSSHKAKPEKLLPLKTPNIHSHFWKCSTGEWVPCSTRDDPYCTHGLLTSMSPCDCRIVNKHKFQMLWFSFKKNVVKQPTVISKIHMICINIVCIYIYIILCTCSFLYNRFKPTSCSTWNHIIFNFWPPPPFSHIFRGICPCYICLKSWLCFLPQPWSRV